MNNFNVFSILRYLLHDLNTKAWKYCLSGYSSGMNPTRYGGLSSGNRNLRLDKIQTDNNLSPIQQGEAQSYPADLQMRKPEAAEWRSWKLSEYGKSNLSSHETTPLFGLWKGVEPTKSPVIEKTYNLNASESLFLPDQNETKIIAHIGTTVIMDCRLSRPNLEENAPVRLHQLQEHLIF